MKAIFKLKPEFQQNEQQAKELIGAYTNEVLTYKGETIPTYKTQYIRILGMRQ